MRMTNLDIGTEPRYSLAEASYLTAVPRATLRTWFVGWHSAGRAPRPPVLCPEQDAVDPLTLSFYNVIEARSWRPTGVWEYRCSAFALPSNTSKRRCLPGDARS